MLYRSLGTSVRADRPLDTNSHSPSGDEASPGNRPETPTMAMGAVASPKVSPMPVSGTRVRSQPVVRGGGGGGSGSVKTVCTEPKSVPFLYA